MASTINIIVSSGNMEQAVRALLHTIQNEDNTATTDVAGDNIIPDGAIIRHRAKGTQDYWYAMWKEEDKQLVGNSIPYISLSGFAGFHYKKVRPDRTSCANGWDECEYLKDGVWMKMDSLRK